MSLSHSSTGSCTHHSDSNSSLLLCASDRHLEKVRKQCYEIRDYYYIMDSSSPCHEEMADEQYYMVFSKLYLGHLTLNITILQLCLQ